MVLLAVKIVADVTETSNVIPSLEFKTCMTIKFKVFTIRISTAMTLIGNIWTNNLKQPINSTIITDLVLTY